MLEIKISVAESIAQKINNIKPDAEIKATEIASMLEYPPDAKMGDLALPCFKMSKTLRMSPVKIAEAVAEAALQTSLAMLLRSMLTMLLPMSMLRGRMVMSIPMGRR